MHCAPLGLEQVRNEEPPMTAAAHEAAPEKPAYENDRYWTQRLEREFTLAGVGHAGVGLAFNRWAYRVRRKVLLRALEAHGVAVAGAGAAVGSAVAGASGTGLVGSTS